MINADALLESWPTYQPKLLQLKNQNYRNEAVFNTWSEEVSTFLVLLKALHSCQNRNRTGARPTFASSIDKLIVFRIVIVYTIKVIALSHLNLK